jgi:hypothetical protein
MRFKLTLWVGLCCALVSGASFAQTSSLSSGLGQAWPNVADQSLSPHWHAYVFRLNGVEYVQINDTNGTVHGAVATVGGGNTMVLPIGTDAQTFTATAVSPSTTSSSSTTVYQDANVTILAVPQSNGTMLLEAECGASVQCQGGH